MMSIINLELVKNPRELSKQFRLIYRFVSFVKTKEMIFRYIEILHGTYNIFSSIMKMV